MRVIKGSCRVPVIYTAHHASHDFREFEEKVALSQELKIRFSDYGTGESVPQNGIATVVAEHSRALGDLNRNPDDPERFQLQDYAKPDRHPIWHTEQGLGDSDKLYCHENYYEPFHREIVRQLRKRNDLTFVVAWDNTAHYEIGRDERDTSVTMKPFILSNRGAEESASAQPGENTSCDPLFLEMLARYLSVELENRGLPSEIHLNLVFKGGYICRTYSTWRHKKILNDTGVSCEVQSLQIEYDTEITHDQVTLKEKPDKIIALREAFSEAITKTLGEYKTNFMMQQL